MAAGPPGIGQLTSINRAPTDAQRDRIDTFSRHWASKLLSSDLADVNEARGELLGPLNKPGLPGAPGGVTIVFRNTYADLLIPRLEPVIGSESDPMGAMNAVLIVSELATEDSLNVLMSHCNRRDEARVPIRVWSARGLRTALDRGLQLGSVRRTKEAPVIRELGRSVQEEDDWRVLRWQLDAIASRMTTETTGGPSVAQDVLLESLDSVITRLSEQSTPTRMMGSIQPALTALRDRIIDPQLAPAAQRQLGREITPRLVAVLAIPDKHPQAREDDEMRRIYESVIRVCEGMLEFIDSNIGGGIGKTELVTNLPRRQPAGLPGPGRADPGRHERAALQVSRHRPHQGPRARRSRARCYPCAPAVGSLDASPRSIPADPRRPARGGGARRHADHGRRRVREPR